MKIFQLLKKLNQAGLQYLLIYHNPNTTVQIKKLQHHQSRQILKHHYKGVGESKKSIPLHTQMKGKSVRHSLRKTSSETTMDNLLFIYTKKHHLPFGDSLINAEHRFHLLGKRHDKQKYLLQDYSNFMLEYLKLGHMELTNQSQLNTKATLKCLITYHTMLSTKKISFMTKTGVVFSALAQTNNRTSLNDALLRLTIQQDLF